MAVDVRSICAIRALRLRVVAGERGLDRHVRWVHVSETIDPTPWLKGGELLLTTGMQLDAHEGHEAYIDRLADADLAGVGFGVGMSHAVVSEEMRRAADRRSLPLLEVPIETPYVAISESVSDMLNTERDAVVARAFHGQQALTLAAVAGSASEIVRETARLLSGWAMHVDAAGRVISASPADAERYLPALTSDVMRLRDGPARSATTSTATESVALHTLSTDGLARGFLVCGVTGRFGDYERMILSAAVALLTLETERSRRASVRMLRARSESLSGLFGGRVAPASTARQLLAWGLDPGALRVIAVLAPPVGARQLYGQVVDHIADTDGPGGAVLVRETPEDSIVGLLLNAEGSPDVLPMLCEVAERRRGMHVGVGSPVGLEQVPESYRSTVRAARVGRIERRTVTQVDDLQAIELVLRSAQPDAVGAFVDQVLGPLAASRATGRLAELRRTLIAFLTSNGHWNETAAVLGVHRHTLRGRIDRIEEITGRDLTSSYTRMEMWLAVLAEGGQADAPLLEV